MPGQFNKRVGGDQQQAALLVILVQWTACGYLTLHPTTHFSDARVTGGFEKSQVRGRSSCAFIFLLCLLWDFGAVASHRCPSSAIGSGGCWKQQPWSTRCPSRLRAFVVISEACFSLSLVHPSTASFYFFSFSSLSFTVLFLFFTFVGWCRRPPSSCLTRFRSWVSLFRCAARPRYVSLWCWRGLGF
jgi:hypothetical protein